MSNASAEVAPARRAELHMRLMAEELIAGAATSTLADRLYGLSDLAAVGRGFVATGSMRPDVTAEILGGARDAIALRSSDDPDLPRMFDTADLLAAASAPPPASGVPAVIAVGREVWAPPWDPFMVTTVELWPGRGVVRYASPHSDGPGHRAVAAIEMVGRGGAEYRVYQRTGWLEQHSGAWEFSPAPADDEVAIEITIAGMPEALVVELHPRRTSEGGHPDAPVTDSGVLDPAAYVELVAEEELAEVGRAGHARVTRARRAVAAVADAFGRAGLIDVPPVRSAVDAALAGAGYLPSPPDGLVGRFDWIGLAFPRPSLNRAELRATIPLAVQVAGTDAPLVLLSVEDWRTHAIVHAVDADVADPDRWWRLQGDDGSRAVGRVLEPTRRSAGSAIEVQFDPGIDLTLGPAALIVGRGAAWSSVAFRAATS